MYMYMYVNLIKSGAVAFGICSLFILISKSFTCFQINVVNLFSSEIQLTIFAMCNYYRAAKGLNYPFSTLQVYKAW